MELMIEDVMESLVEQGGSDIHIQAGAPIYFRIHGKLTPQPQFGEQMDAHGCQRLIFSMLNNTQRKELEQNWELDCAYGVKGLARFRVNVYRERGCFAACLRALASKIPNFEKLGVPEIMKELAERPRGMVLVTGQTGSGKTTTLAAILDMINRTRAEHILTVEDPIEYVFPNVKSLFHQRQKGEDTKSFANALKAALREDPDIILVGEMRDLETISLAVSAAETGHLVFGTLHTNSAAGTIDRMLDVFPPIQQPQIRAQMSGSLVGICSQNLVPKMGGGRVAAQEIMVNTPAIANLIREGKTSQIYSAIQTGAKLGMQTMEMCLARLYNEGKVSYEDAMSKSSRPDELARLIGAVPSGAKGKVGAH
ncbi:type IV pilus twitching motility protein PilT [Desertifilum sp. FACHB-1129]|uniref:Twitching motility protein PilT n=2 Tax=Cyanophyceae TaxID=3028117 RepID=A0A1E5QRF9_9CYAN|nr:MULTISPECIES: type IV pilus twitching motility protein PilT [Cyanophyceae]MDA0208697.1 type IV pilus twitching motility protein PilT [Cyanobacteria bacterium FC1]MDI9640371.1 type IV pilus twitching motility protein PilT [Geitlerinema splendidum]MDK3155578.1 type IV pilus twitching motility protein PilT [Kamptonema cortianum]MDL5044749.1 type IV pilus twitching motility protein PilT [Oscillatoria amoena NRMC-F 0135]MBD2310897.1 type IV pilus twitching motility protein PilT [Desertifilum sp.